MRAEYLLLLAAAFLPPLLLSLHRNVRRAIWSRPLRLILALLGMCVPFWIWDVWATARGHWSFDPRYTLGLRLLGLPLEELLFFPLIGFIGLFLWEVVKFYRKER
ncbi:MAG: lycopene cyclase domain-containing protein [Bacteroidota bacterium]|nr:lycopene cyclase domain-containing protein [Bacteroidota bacterium]